MKAALSIALGLALLFALTLTAPAEAKKAEEPRTFEGSLTCAKCDLKLTTKCATVLKVKEGGKDVVYYLDAASHKKHHTAICPGAKQAKVTGTVSEKDGRKILTATDVKIEP